MHGEILFNRKEYKQALADYKQLQTRATTAERRQLGVTGVLRCGVLLKDDIEVIHTRNRFTYRSQTDSRTAK